MSIRRRLLVWLLSCVLAGGLAAASVVFFQARSEVDEIFDYQLRQLALTLRDRTYLTQQLGEALQGEEAYDVVIQVWGPDGALLYASRRETIVHHWLKSSPERIASAIGQAQAISSAMASDTARKAAPFLVRHSGATKCAAITAIAMPTGTIQLAESAATPSVTPNAAPAAIGRVAA